MYTDEQSRINAVTSYFFLGPIFLLAKAGTPLGDTYVRAHAKKSSAIIGVMFLTLLVYFFVRPYIGWTIPGIGLDTRTIVLIAIVGMTIVSLMKGAYRAYQGIGADEVDVGHVEKLRDLTSISGVYEVEKEEEKIRILTSMIPFIGIFVSSRFDHPLITRGRIIGSALAFLYIVSLLFFTAEGFLSFIILVLGVLLFVIEGVYLMLYGRFLSWGVLDRLPSYAEVETHIITILYQIREFFMVSMGKEKSMSYDAQYSTLLRENIALSGEVAPYFMPAGLLAIPFWNLFGIPSLFIERYRAYRRLVVQGLIITLIISYLWFYRGMWTSPWILLLLFPIVHIFTYGSIDPATRSPGIGLITRLFSTFRGRNTEKKVEEEKFTYEVEPVEKTEESK